MNRALHYFIAYSFVWKWNKVPYFVVVVCCLILSLLLLVMIVIVFVLYCLF